MVKSGLSSLFTNDRAVQPWGKIVTMWTCHRQLFKFSPCRKLNAWRFFAMFHPKQPEEKKSSRGLLAALLCRRPKCKISFVRWCTLCPQIRFRIYVETVETRCYWCAAAQWTRERFCTISTDLDHTLHGICAAVYVVIIHTYLSRSSLFNRTKTIRRARHNSVRWRQGCLQEWCSRHNTLRSIQFLSSLTAEICVKVSQASDFDREVVTKLLIKAAHNHTDFDKRQNASCEGRKRFDS